MIKFLFIEFFYFFFSVSSLKLLWLEIYLFSKKQDTVLSIKIKFFIKNLFTKFLLENFNSLIDLELFDEGILSLFHKLLLLESQTEEKLKQKDWFSTLDGIRLFPVENGAKIPSRTLAIINTAIGLFYYGFYDASAVFIRKSIESALCISFQMMNRENEIREIDGSLKKLDLCFDLLIKDHLITKSQRSRLNQCKALADEAVHNFRINYFSKEEVEKAFQTIRFSLINLFIEVEKKINSKKNN